MHFVSERRDHRLVAVASALIALAFVALFAFAARAQAAETLYWNNYSDDPDTIGFANPDGSGGGALDLGGVELDGPEGMAVDPVTGRLYIAAISNGPESKGEIVFANLSGGGGGVFTAPGAPVSSPEGVAIDPATRMKTTQSLGRNSTAVPAEPSTSPALTSKNRTASLSIQWPVGCTGAAKTRTPVNSSSPTPT
jgi:hypothetical protein